MSTPSRAAKARAIRQLMASEGAAVAQNTRGFNAGRYAAVATLDEYEALKDRARQIKEHAIEQLPELIEQVRHQIERRGGTVYLAEDAADANRHIAEIAAGARRLVKSKSMTTEEIRVNEHLEACGIEVVETDLGEWVIQVAEEEPSHIVAPAIHKSRAAIAELFNRRFAPDEPLETAEELTQFARERLGALIKGADVGMTGANFITADTGSIVLVTSEGNARKTALVPPIHIAVAGVEKIIPTVEDLQPFVELIGRSGTGQDITSYVSLLTPPVASPVPDFAHPDRPMATGRQQERAFHLVLIDNGRLAMREDPQLRETLYCIRCGACANVCANFQQVGGHAFGGETYAGGIATGWEAGVHGLEVAGTFNDLCTGCSRCAPACPVKIDIPWINVVVRDRLNNRSSDDRAAYQWLARGLVPDNEPNDLDVAKRIFGHFHRWARLGSRLAPLSNWGMRSKPVRYLMERYLGIDRRREMPTFRRTTLRTWFRERGQSVQRESPHGATPEVVLFCDAYTNYVRTERGKAAVRALEALGVRVRLSVVEESGRAPLSQGMVTTAAERARAVVQELVQHVEAGREVVVIEPSDLAMFKHDYRKLLPESDWERLQANSFEIMDYVRRVIEAGGDPDALRTGNGQQVAYHSHCQQRTLGLEAPTVALMQRLGYDVLTSEVECCGMAGSFGYKTEYYELSMQVGEQLREQFATAEAQGRMLTASGTSCQEQLEALSGQSVQHPVELIAPRNADVG